MLDTHSYLLGVPSFLTVVPGVFSSPNIPDVGPLPCPMKVRVPLFYMTQHTR